MFDRIKIFKLRKKDIFGFVLLSPVFAVIVWMLFIGTFIRIDPDIQTAVPISQISSPAPTEISLTVHSTKEFTEEQFYWDRATKPWKTIIMKGVNKVHNENPRCANLDPSSAYVSIGKGTKQNPMFFVTCEPSDEPVFNYFFSKSDIEGNKTLGPTKHIGRSIAAELCEQYARNKTQNLKNVKFSQFIDLGFQEYPNGNTRVKSSIEGTNQIGMNLEFAVECLMDDKGFLEGKISKK